MRLYDFRAGDFSKLEKRLGEIDWELYLLPRKGLRISVASAKSRLYHKGAVAERVRETLARFKELQDIIALLGVEELGSSDRLIVKRARRLQRFFWDI